MREIDLKGVIFDLDGTVADTVPLCLNSIRDAVKETTGKDCGKEEIEKYFGLDEQGMIKNLDPENNEKCFLTYLKLLEENHSIIPEIFEGMKEVFDFIKQNNLKMGMVTGRTRPSALISLKYYGIENYFEFLETGSPYGFIKEQGVGKILEKWNISGSNAIYLGDTTADVEMCLKTGINPIAAGWASTTETSIFNKYPQCKIFYTIKDFKNWLESISSFVIH